MVIVFSFYLVDCDFWVWASLTLSCLEFTDFLFSVWLGFCVCVHNLESLSSSCIQILFLHYILSSGNSDDMNVKPFNIVRWGDPCLWSPHLKDRGRRIVTNQSHLGLYNDNLPAFFTFPSSWENNRCVLPFQALWSFLHTDTHTHIQKLCSLTLFCHFRSLFSPLALLEIRPRVLHMLYRHSLLSYVLVSFYWYFCFGPLFPCQNSLFFTCFKTVQIFGWSISIIAVLKSLPNNFNTYITFVLVSILSFAMQVHISLVFCTPSILISFSVAETKYLTSLI